MAEATNPITTASNPRVGEDVGQELDWLRKQVVELCEHTEDEMYEALQKGTTNEHEIGFYKGRKWEAKGIRRAICEVIRLRKAEIASAPSPEAGAVGDLGELERLSAGAPAGEWHPDLYDANDEDGGPTEVACDGIVTYDGEDDAAGQIASCGRRVAEFVCALVNAYRSGKLVASTGSGEETKGATPMGSGHSRAEPSGLGASPECPSRSVGERMGSPFYVQGVRGKLFDAIGKACAGHDIHVCGEGRMSMDCDRWEKVKLAVDAVLELYIGRAVDVCATHEPEISALAERVSAYLRGLSDDLTPLTGNVTIRMPVEQARALAALGTEARSAETFGLGPKDDGPACKATPKSPSDAPSTPETE